LPTYALKVAEARFSKEIMKVTVTLFFTLDRFGQGFCGVYVLRHYLSPSKKAFDENDNTQETSLTLATPSVA